MLEGQIQLWRWTLVLLKLIVEYGSLEKAMPRSNVFKVYRDEDDDCFYMLFAKPMFLFGMTNLLSPRLRFDILIATVMLKFTVFNANTTAMLYKMAVTEKSESR